MHLATVTSWSFDQHSIGTAVAVKLEVEDGVCRCIKEVRSCFDLSHNDICSYADVAPPPRRNEDIACEIMHGALNSHGTVAMHCIHQRDPEEACACVQVVSFNLIVEKFYNTVYNGTIAYPTEEAPPGESDSVAPRFYNNNMIYCHKMTGREHNLHPSRSLPALWGNELRLSVLDAHRDIGDMSSCAVGLNIDLIPSKFWCQGEYRYWGTDENFFIVPFIMGYTAYVYKPGVKWITNVRTW